MDRNHGACFRLVAGAKAGEQFGHCGAVARFNELGCDLVQRDENERTFGQPGMRNFQIGFTETKISHHQDIQIESTGAVGNFKDPVTAVLPLNGEETREQGAWGQACLECDSGVDEAGLIGEPNGRGRVERGSAHDVAQRLQMFEGGDECSGGRSSGAGKVCAHSDVGGQHGCCPVSGRKERHTARRRRDTAARAVSAANQTAKTMRTAHAGATPTCLSRKGRKFHVVMWT